LHPHGQAVWLRRRLRQPIRHVHQLGLPRPAQRRQQRVPYRLRTGLGTGALAAGAGRAGPARSVAAGELANHDQEPETAYPPVCLSCNCYVPNSIESPALLCPWP